MAMKGKNMQDAPEIFDVVTTPLHRGVNFIEASAGTGKTYAIAMLVLRAICEQNISIDRLLIVTFTRAAAEELKTRVRARLVQARDLIVAHERGEACDAGDTSLTSWLAQQNHADLHAYLARLQLAIVDIDRAGIFTIHGFCQRMLTEQALESGQLFDADLVSDINDLIQTATRDFWRREVYPLELWQCDLLLKEVATPSELQKSFKPLDDAFQVYPQLPPLSALWDELKTAQGQIGAWWDCYGEDYLQQLEGDAGQGYFKKELAEGLGAWAASCRRYFTEGGLVPEHLEWFSSLGFGVQINGNKFRGKAGAERREELLASYHFADEAEERFSTLYQNILVAFRMYYQGEVQKAVENQLLHSGSLSFDALISRLAMSLKSEDGQLLAGLLQKRYDLALIDEFQDTDSKQWQIFASLFAGGTHGLYLIGDPKQAIYKFRGADIFSYFNARDYADHFYSLGTNYRSHPSLVEAVNDIFTRRDNPFLFLEEGLSYQAVRAGQDGSIRVIDEQSSASMIYMHLEGEAWTSGEAREIVHNKVLSEILRLLGAGAIEKDGEKRAIKPQNIAILVRSNREAARYQQELLDLGVPAIIAGKKTIFETKECRELILLLSAIAGHDDLRLLKSAMTLSLFNFSGDELHELWQDERKVALWYERFYECYDLWQKSGVLVMLHHLVSAYGLFENLACLPQAQRRIANFNHLFEVLQEAEREGNLGPRQTLLWLRTSYDHPDSGESYELRLERDDEALSVVTMHSSKGLQYPLVFCPDLYHRGAKLKHEKKRVVCYKNGSLLVDYGSEDFDDHKEKALAEEKAEDLRLAYVALTRAELRCYVVWADIKASGSSVMASQDSALAYLLFGKREERLGGDEQAKTLHSFEKEAVAEYQGLSLAPEPLLPYEAEQECLQLGLPAERARNISTNWQMTSYSGIARQSEHSAIHTPRKEKEEKGDNGDGADGGEDAVLAVASLPKGARFGTALHDALEKNPFGIFLGEKTEDMAEKISQLCKRYGLKMDEDLFWQLLRSCVSAPLHTASGDVFCLAELDESESLAEMEFYLRLARVDVHRISQILANEPTVQALNNSIVQGYLTGFIDLICIHDGKYYVIDYKSNYLGDHALDYERDNLTAAMASHNYGLQYALYSVVLHRHLARFVEDYSYDRDFGGVLYLFARGMDESRPGCGVYSTKMAVETIEALSELLVEGY